MIASFLKICNSAFSRSPILFIAGLVTIALGSVKQQPWITRLGTGMFLSGASVFMIALGGRDLFFKLLLARSKGRQLMKESPLDVAFPLTLILLGIGWLWLIRGYFIPK